MEITVLREEGLRFQVQSGPHRAVIDMPYESGGTDRGMTPPQLFVASLGACIGIYIVENCERAGIDCQELKIDLEWQLADNPKRIGAIQVTIALPFNEVTPAREKAILAVARHCLIHSTLVHAPELSIHVGRCASEEVLSAA